jgi:hypothetical protein
MNPTAVGALVLACTFSGALGGIWLRRVLPEPHLNSESSATVKLGVGLIATMTALVLGLVTASARGSFDAMSTAVRHAAADVLTLDRTLARYGPETADAREALYHLVEVRLETLWPQGSARALQLDVPDVRSAETIVARIQALAPHTDEQQSLQSRALNLGEALLGTRWVVSSAAGTSILVPFLAVLLFWLSITFASFGLFAPRNVTVIGTLFVCAVSVASAVFLILEMDGPFEGLIRVSPDPLRHTLAQMNR